MIGAAVGLLPADLGERLMLGDTGANLLGAVLGLAVVLETSRPVRTGVLIVLIVLNLASERVSFTKVIDATPGLRHLDRLGRQPGHPTSVSTLQVATVGRSVARTSGSSAGRSRA